jgi:hypothetical protein
VDDLTFIFSFTLVVCVKDRGNLRLSCLAPFSHLRIDPRWQPVIKISNRCPLDNIFPHDYKFNQVLQLQIGDKNMGDMSKADAERIQSAEAKKNAGQVKKGSFAARATSVVAKNSKKK